MVALASALVVATVSVVARAQESHTLEAATTVAPGPCLEKQRLVARTVVWLGGSDIDRHVAARVEETVTGVHLVIQRDDEVVGERTLELRTSACDDVLEAAALALASALDGKLVQAPTQGKPGAPPPRDTAPPLRSPIGQRRIASPPGPPEPARRAEWHPHLTVAVDVGMLASVVPEPAMGFEPAVELAVVPWFDLRASALISQTVTVTLLNEARLPRGYADVDLVAGRLDACFVQTVGRGPRIRTCVAVAAGAVATDRGFDEVTEPTAPWVAPSARLDVRFDAAEGFGIGLAAEGYVPVVRPDRVIGEGGDGNASTGFPEAGFALFAGPSYRF